MYPKLLNDLQITTLCINGEFDIKDSVWQVMKNSLMSIAKYLNWRSINGTTTFHRLLLNDVITVKCNLVLPI